MCLKTWLLDRKIVFSSGSPQVKNPVLDSKKEDRKGREEALFLCEQQNYFFTNFKKCFKEKDNKPQAQ